MPVPAPFFATAALVCEPEPAQTRYPPAWFMGRLDRAKLLICDN
jgi:hypothetical protein